MDEEAFNSFCGGLPRVSEGTNKELEGPLTAEEVYMALQSMQGGRPLGSMDSHQSSIKLSGLN